VWLYIQHGSSAWGTPLLQWITPSVGRSEQCYTPGARSMSTSQPAASVAHSTVATAGQSEGISLHSSTHMGGCWVSPHDAAWPCVPTARVPWPAAHLQRHEVHRWRPVAHEQLLLVGRVDVGAVDGHLHA
jgi:hypothetical protein